MAEFEEDSKTKRKRGQGKLYLKILFLDNCFFTHRKDNIDNANVGGKGWHKR